MGNSCHRCFGITSKNNNKYIRSDLSQSRDFSIEFENLMTNDYFDDLSISSKKENGAPFTVSSYMKWLSDQERSFMTDDNEGVNELQGHSPNSLPTTAAASGGATSSAGLIPVGLPVQKPDPTATRCSQWETFSSDPCTSGPISNNHNRGQRLPGYFLDELSRDLGVSRELIEGCCCGVADPSGAPIVTYQEEEIDGPELARLIRRMRPRDLLVSSADFLGPLDSSGTGLYHRVHHNLARGVKEFSTTNSDKDNQSSIDLDWDHEPGMNPSLALAHKRTDTEEDLVKRLQQSEEILVTTPTAEAVPAVSSLTHVLPNSCPPISMAPIEVPLSPQDPLFSHEELAWDMEEDLYEAAPPSAEESGLDNDRASPDSSIMTRDTCQLLSS